MNRPSRLKLSDVNPNLLCVLCGGYFIDATTIVECLHSFCKTCIVRYLETSKYCPICDVQVHKTKPLQNIRADHTLQSIVYKLVPGLYQNEMKQRQEFYVRHPEVPPVSEYDAGVINEETSCIYCPDETIALCLEYCGKTTSSSTHDDLKSNYLFSPANKDVHQHRRYFRCPAAVTVSHLKKLLRSKYGISADHRVDIMYTEELLKEEYSLMDVAYIYSWKRKGVMRFTYRIFERPHKRRKLDLERCKTTSNFVTDAGKIELLGSANETKAVEDSERLNHDQIPSVPELNLKNEDSEEKTKEKCDISGDGGAAVGGTAEEQWKEVQLQISENGIMSVRNMDDLVSAVEGGALSGAFNETIISSGKVEESAGEMVKKSELSSNALAEKDISKLPEKVRDKAENSKETTTHNQTLKSISECSEAVGVKPPLSVGNKDINCPSALPPKTSVLDKMSEQRPSGGVRYGFPKKDLSSKPKDTNGKEVGGDLGSYTHPVESPQLCASAPSSTVTPSVSLMPITHSTAASNTPSTTTAPKRSNSAPVGYKTLKTPPKTWNPSIPRSKVLANHSAFGKSGVGSVANHNGSMGVPGLHAISPSKPEASVDGKANYSGTEGNGGVRLPPTSSPKPLRFFKMRNNMPRYLGNPSSGVKPMYSLHPGAGGTMPAPTVTPKPPLPPLTKLEPKTNSTAQAPLSSSSIVPECKTDKSPTAAKVAFPVPPTSRSGHPKPQQSGVVLQTTATLAGHSPSVVSQQSCHMTSHAQLPLQRTSQGSGAPASSASSSPGFHSSLPPSISMIFGQSRPGERPVSQTPPPAVQRVPASVHHPPHHFHHPVTPIHLLQHRQLPGKVNGELSNNNGGGESNNVPKSGKSLDVLPAPVVAPPQPSEAQKAKDDGSGEVAVKEPINGKIEGSSVPAIASPTSVVEGKNMAPSKC
ncbi:polycomb group protein Psc-like [Ischnura elegans]|uniref:polycomb group protein Psc-like n=1 Tax=Ischnura elegans TaxID=197161 RepID=UPI001ED89CEA|nr:polycomb group protein Psc-like [Ischnura elegans]XP_046387466.1 polycomb group protein Psc-like [Ischnura elegans]